MLRIEELRDAQGLTLRDLDQATGINAQTIWRYSVGKQSPSIERAYLLSRALGVTLDELYVHDANATDGLAVCALRGSENTEGTAGSPSQENAAVPR